MRELVLHLNKRRKIMMSAVFALSLMAIIVSYNFQITPTSYFDGKFNTYFLIGLIVYKLLELPVLYYILLHRHVIYLKKNLNVSERLPKIKKHARLLLFLIPQGNTVFGIISYKLTGEVVYFLLFSLIAIVTLLLVRPNKLI